MEYHVSLTSQDLSIISAALVELPFKIVAPVIQNINVQIAKQEQKTETGLEEKP